MRFINADSTLGRSVKFPGLIASPSAMSHSISPIQITNPLTDPDLLTRTGGRLPDRHLYPPGPGELLDHHLVLANDCGTLGNCILQQRLGGVGDLFAELTQILVVVLDHKG